MGFPPAISQIVMVNVIVFLLQPLVLKSFMLSGLALVPAQVVTKGMVWELVTYMFLHGGFMHLAFNMFALVIFGSDLERWWGSRDFVKYYFVTGAGAGVIHVLMAYIFPGTGGAAPFIPTIGASGAVFGILLAFGLAFPQRRVLLFMVVPVSARTMVILYGILELSMAVQYQGGDGVARFAHLGGMLVGYLYLKHETLFWRVRRLWQGAQGSVGTRARRASPPPDAASKEEIDRILDKISREGMGSLTKEERRILSESADRARKRQHGDPQ
jgi:membrane associated rhomboid family serine protease